MKKIKSTIFAIFSLLGLLQLGSCKDDVIYDNPEMDYKGPVSLKLDFNFEPLAEGLSSRGVAGNLYFGINDLVIVFYDKEADEATGSPVYTFSFNGEDCNLRDEERPNSTTEARTQHGYVTISDIEPGEYRIYAVANVKDRLTFNGSDCTNSEKSLREIQIAWPSAVTPSGTVPLTNGIPDAMFGYFTTNVSDHVQKSYRNVVYHNLALYPQTSENSIDHKDNNRAKVVTLNKENLEIQAWLKRVVSKLTIGFDGSKLKDGVEIYIKNVQIKDVANSCFLGHDNSVGNKNNVAGSSVSLVPNDNSDSRLNFVYNENEGSEGQAITRATPAFPRSGEMITLSTSADDDHNGWSKTWYEYVHGNLNNNDPRYNNYSTTLYFLENLQGVSAETLKLQTKETVDNYVPGGKYDKDGVTDGTYVEVTGYYKNTNKNTQGRIVYRFMLGKNITNDFNTERNHHYKLILSFIGDANDVDWHIDYEEENPREEGYYFRIPYNIDDYAQDIKFSDTANNEDWFMNENWKPSYVWYVYDQNNKPIAEVVKELIYYDYYDYKRRDPRNDSELKNQGDVKLRKFYQVVTVYPIYYGGPVVEGETDYSQGLIAQVLECDSEMPGQTYMTKKEGAKIGMVDRDAINNNVLNASQYGKRGDCVITGCELTPEIANGSSQDSHANYLYGKYDPSTSEISLIEAPLQIKLETRPWRVKDNDADNNLYPIVKIGASYWFRENLRAYHYSYPETEALESYHSGVESKKDRDCVYMHENARMYKFDENYGCLYNLAAISGDPDNDPWIDGLGNSGFCLCQKGTDYYDGVKLWDEDNEWQITPKNWHIPTAKMKWEPGAFWESHIDQQYLMDYVSDNLARCIVNKGSMTWPSFPDVTVPNLSGLSLLAIPADGVSSITYDLDPNQVSKGNLAGVCVPFWTDVLYRYSDGVIYANSPFMCLSDNNYYVTTTVVTSLIEMNSYGGYYQELSKQYLPVRPVRHAKLRQPASWQEINGRWAPVSQ